MILSYIMLKLKYLRKIIKNQIKSDGLGNVVIIVLFSATFNVSDVSDETRVTVHVIVDDLTATPSRAEERSRIPW